MCTEQYVSAFGVSAVMMTEVGVFPLFPQSSERALRPLECRDRSRHNRFKAGRHGLHHLDVLLPQAGHEPQVRCCEADPASESRQRRLTAARLSCSGHMIC